MHSQHSSPKSSQPAASERPSPIDAVHRYLVFSRARQFQPPKRIGDTPETTRSKPAHSLGYQSLFEPFRLNRAALQTVQPDLRKTNYRDEFFTDHPAALRRRKRVGKSHKRIVECLARRSASCQIDPAGDRVSQWDKSSENG
jgi:hypothetical protein